MRKGVILGKKLLLAYKKTDKIEYIFYFIIKNILYNDHTYSTYKVGA